MASSFPTRDELLENFSFLGDWEERYGYLLELGKRLPAFPEAEKNDTNIVRGCTSQVWMIAQSPPDNDSIAFLADSDAHIVRGLIGILYAVYNGQKKSVVRDLDIEAFFAQLGLAEHLSPNRRNGFFSMVERLKSMAA